MGKEDDERDAAYLKGTKTPECSDFLTHREKRGIISIMCRYKRALNFPGSAQYCLHYGEEKTGCPMGVFWEGNGQYGSYAASQRQLLEQQLKSGVPGAMLKLEELNFLQQIIDRGQRPRPSRSQNQESPPPQQNESPAQPNLCPPWEEAAKIRAMIDQSFDDVRISHTRAGKIRIEVLGWPDHTLDEEEIRLRNIFYK